MHNIYNVVLINEKKMQNVISWANLNNKKQDRHIHYVQLE